MPATYVRFLKAGRLCIPVELYFISSSSTEEQNDKISPLCWPEVQHWNDIKDMLKPAVEVGLKHHNDVKEGWQHNVGGPRIAHKNDTKLGYVFLINKNGKFTDLLELRQISTDTDDHFVDEDSGLKDFGGQFKRYPPTRVYIKACALLRSGNDVEDEKKICKELGIKPDSSLLAFLNQSQLVSNNKT